IESNAIDSQIPSVSKILESLYALRVINPKDVSYVIESEARSALDENRLDKSIQMISMLSMSCRSVALDPVFHQLICDIVAYAEKF
ncbi:hypothetical protein, partial [Escherichia coli]